VFVDATVQVPVEYVKNNEIVLNVGFEATSALKLGNELIEFRARFGGSSREIRVPIDHVIAIYARENGQGMAFPMPADAQAATESAAPPQVPRGTRPKLTDVATAGKDAAPQPEPAEGQPPPEPPPSGRPSLKRIK
jgi:stringent starvation protein B